MSISSPWVAHPAVQGSSDLLLPLGVRRLRAYAPARNARYCHTTVTNADAAGVEADLDVLDEHGTVLLALRGLQLEPRPLSTPAAIVCFTSGC